MRGRTIGTKLIEVARGQLMWNTYLYQSCFLCFLVSKPYCIAWSSLQVGVCSHMKEFWPLSSVQSLSHVWMFAAPWTAAYRASLSITSSQKLLKLMSIKSVMPSNHLILCHPLLLLPSIFPSIRVFSNESFLCIRWPKYWSFSVSISPLNEYSGLISFRMDWLDLLAVQGTLKSLLQHHSVGQLLQQFKSINSLALSFLYGPTFTSIHVYWKNHSFD